MHITHADEVSAPTNFDPGYFESSVSLSPSYSIQYSHKLFLVTRKADVQPLIWGYKFTREIARRMPHFRGEPSVLHPSFAPGGPASIVEHAEGPVPFDAPRIVYSEEDERALEAFVRANGARLPPFSASLTFKILAHFSFLHSFLIPGGAVATSGHSVSSSLLMQCGTSLKAWAFAFAIVHQLGTCAMKPREQGGVVDAKLNVYGVHGLKVADLSIAPGNVSANTYGTALVIGEKAAVIIAEELRIKSVTRLPRL